MLRDVHFDSTINKKQIKYQNQVVRLADETLPKTKIGCVCGEGKENVNFISVK